MFMFWFLRFEGYLLIFHFTAYCKTKAHTHFTVISTLAQIIGIGKKNFSWRPYRIPKYVRNLKSDDNYGRYNIKLTVGAKKKLCIQL